MSIEENKRLVRRFYQEVDAGNLEAMDDLVAEDYQDHSPPPFPGLAAGREGLKQAFRLFWEATPGVHEIEDQIAEGDKVVTRLTGRGMCVGDLPGIPATGRPADHDDGDGDPPHREREARREVVGQGRPRLPPATGRDPAARRAPGVARCTLGTVQVVFLVTKSAAASTICRRLAQTRTHEGGLRGRDAAREDHPRQCAPCW
ncbi:ester cyclase [Streptomyces sp. CB02056]|uniref:ester cyclase n=1 Tax=Streptomyces sp. CB02056 TaxID=1703924 RepID=UPI000A588539|nr:ester cyclase [Streptomyces sp. CB02056]